MAARLLTVVLSEFRDSMRQSNPKLHRKEIMHLDTDKSLTSISGSWWDSPSVRRSLWTYPASLLHFDPHLSFFFCPPSASKDLILTGSLASPGVGLWIQLVQPSSTIQLMQAAHTTVRFKIVEGSKSNLATTLWEQLFETLTLRFIKRKDKIRSTF